MTRKKFIGFHNFIKLFFNKTYFPIVAIFISILSMGITWMLFIVAMKKADIEVSVPESDEKAAITILLLLLSLLLGIISFIVSFGGFSIGIINVFKKKGVRKINIFSLLINFFITMFVLYEGIKVFSNISYP